MPILAHIAHPRGLGQAAQLGLGGTGVNGGAQTVVHFEQLEHAGASGVAGVIARGATHRHETLAVGRRHFAGRAELAHQPLRQHAQQRRGKQKGLDAHIGQAGNGRDGVVGMECGEHEVTGERGLNGDLRGFEIADFADHHHVGVLPQDGAQSSGKGEVDAGVDLRLADAGQVVLDRVFHRHDAGGAGIESAQRRVQRGGLAAAGRAGDQQNAVRRANEGIEVVEHVGRHAHGAQIQPRRRFVEQAQHGAFAMRARQGGHAHIESAAADAQGDAAVLRQTLFGDIELRKNLDARNQRAMQRLVGPHHFAQRAVHAKAHHRSGFIGLDVNVRSPFARGLGEQDVEHADDGRVVGGFEQVFHRGDVLHQPAQIDVALHFADDRRGAAIAGSVGRADARLQVFSGGAVHRAQHMLALHLGQRRGPRGLAHPEFDALAVVFGQHRLVAAEGIGQGMTHGHGERSFSAAA